MIWHYIVADTGDNCVEIKERGWMRIVMAQQQHPSLNTDGIRVQTNYALSLWDKSLAEMSGGRGGRRRRWRWRSSREVRSSGAISTSDTGGAVGTRSAFAFTAAAAAVALAAAAYRSIKTIKIIWISIIHDLKQPQAALITLFPSWKIPQIKNHTFNIRFMFGKMGNNFKLWRIY